MRLIYDGRIFRMQRAGGINRYFAEVISRLPPAWEPFVVGANDLGDPPIEHANLKVFNGPLFRPRRLSYRVRRYMYSKLLRGSEIIHPTYYSLPEGVSFDQTRSPVVVTVYDMIYANYPDLMDDSSEFLRCQREAVLRADHIVCISRATERDLIDRIPQAAGKTSVIYLASSFDLKQDRLPHPTTNQNTFLYVGGRAAYKNFSFVIRAFAAAARIIKHIRLRIAGAPLADHERWQLHYLNISHLVDVSVFPNEPALRDLYCSSTALLYPSKHEGFGIPPLEAMSCGTVAVTANTTSLPEAVGKGGIMLDPSDENQWTDCILGLARGSIKREDIISRGFEQAAKFSWESTAAQHIQLYSKLYS